MHDDTIRTGPSVVPDELARVEEALSQFEPSRVAAASEAELDESFAELRELVGELRTSRALSNVFGMAAVHPSADVRYRMLDVAATRTDAVAARQYIAERTHDDEDYVGFEAIALCGEERVLEGIDDLASLIGWPGYAPEEVDAESRLEWGGQPVGVGRAVTVFAQTALLGTEDADELDRIEDHYTERGHLPMEYHYNPGLDRDPEIESEAALREACPEGMVFVPGGRYEIGAPADALAYDRFSDTYTEQFTAEVPPFYIDRHPVTVAEYDEFVDSVEPGHPYGHPSQADEKDHRRNTLGEGLDPASPVTGIDYYDAHAYAQWAGKDLPFEEEWEAAARGPEGNYYPWGDEWDPSRCNWAGNAFDTTFDGVEDWSRTLAAEVSDGRAETRTTPVDAFPEGASPFGVEDMIGNVWEYTKTNYLSRLEMHPVFSHPVNSHENLISNTDAFPVIRGGAWSSIPELASGVFRGKDLLTDRHNEIGLRLVVRP